MSTGGEYDGSRVRRDSHLILALLLTSFAAEAQQPRIVHRVGFLGRRGCGVSLDPRGPFWQGLRELGYAEGGNLVIDCREAPGRFDRLPTLAVELIHLKIDVLVAEGTPPSLAAKQATTTIPIVIVAVVDPVGTGLVASLARPGGSVTGASLFPTLEVVVKALELQAGRSQRLSRWRAVESDESGHAPRR